MSTGRSGSKASSVNLVPSPSLSASASGGVQPPVSLPVTGEGSGGVDVGAVGRAPSTVQLTGRGLDIVEPTVMGSEESTNLKEERLKSLLLHLQTESGILDRILYKGKNQHRRCPYFQALLKVRRDVRLLQSSGLGEILSALFPIADGKKPVQNAHLPVRLKKKYPSGKHNYLEGLLGVARLLSQMAEPILMAAIQISFLLAKSFFTGFSLAVLALLARLRVLIQQILLDVVSLFNKVSSLLQKKRSLKPTREGIEAFREYYPSSGDVLTLECVWEKDKFVLLERTHKSDTKNQDLDRGALPSATFIQYETIELFNEVQDIDREFSSENRKDIHDQERCPTDSEPAINSSPTRSESPCSGPNIAERNSVVSASGGNLRGGSVPSPMSLDPGAESRKKKVAFVQVRKSRPSEANTAGPSKKMKLDLLASDAMKSDDPYLSLLLGGSTDTMF